MEALRRIVRLLVRPQDAWDEIAREPIRVDRLIVVYIVPLSLLAPIATSIGMRTFDRSWNPAAGYLVPAEQIFATAATTLFASVISILALAGIFKLIAPMYGSSRDYTDALKVATFGAVPLLLAGATLLMPAMVMVAVVGLSYTVHLYWLGAGRVLNVREGSRAEFVGIALVLLGVASALGGAFASSLGLF